MEVSDRVGRVMPEHGNATGFNPWLFTYSNWHFLPKNAIILYSDCNFHRFIKLKIWIIATNIEIKESITAQYGK